MLFNKLRSIIVNYRIVTLRFNATKVTIEPVDIDETIARIKKLNYENKYLFGKKVKINKNKVVPEIDKVVQESKDQKYDRSSEMYWLTQHTPLLDFTKKTKASKKKVNMEKCDVEETVPKKKSLKLIKKKIEQPEVVMPESHLQDLPKPVSVNIKNNLDDNFESKISTLSAVKPILEIPFSAQHLRAMVNFPLTLGINKSNKTLTSFKNMEDSVKFKMPSVSKILQATMPPASRNALIKWKALKIAELGMEGFEKLQQSHRDRGLKFHGCLQKHFKGEDPSREEIAPVVDIWNSIEPILEEIQVPGVHIEEFLVHPYLKYRGIVDCVAYHEQNLTIIEWKNSDRHKRTVNFTFDAPLQLASYLGMMNTREEYIKNPILTGIIVVAYNDGSPANLFQLTEADLKKYWRLYLHRLQEYWIRVRDGTLPEETI